MSNFTLDWCVWRWHFVQWFNKLLFRRSWSNHLLFHLIFCSILFVRLTNSMSENSQLILVPNWLTFHFIFRILSQIQWNLFCKSQKKKNDKPNTNWRTAILQYWYQNDCNVLFHILMWTNAHGSCQFTDIIHFWPNRCDSGCCDHCAYDRFYWSVWEGGKGTWSMNSMKVNIKNGMEIESRPRLSLKWLDMSVNISNIIQWSQNIHSCNLTNTHTNFALRNERFIWRKKKKPFGIIKVNERI